MSITKELKKAVALYIGYTAQKKGDWTEEIQECIETEISLMAADVEATIFRGIS